MRKNWKAVVGAVLVTGMMLTACGGNSQTGEGAGTEEAGQGNAGAKEIQVQEGNADETPAPELEGYQILWHDEFDGDTLKDEIWTREVREPGWTNNELQEYADSEENVFVEDGHLVLKAVKTTDENGKDYYTSGKVNSQNKADFMYGKVVIRAKVPEGQGLWPAAWMMPTDESFYGQWPKCGEIDIMEVLGNATDTAYSTIHYGEPHGQQQGTRVLESGSYAEDFHEYSLEWEPGEMRFYIDEELVLTCNDWFTAVAGEDEKEYPAPFNQTFFVQMNLAVGGDWPGNPDSTTDFDHAEFWIDHVRVYQKESYETNVAKPVIEAREPDETGNYITDWDFSDESEDLTDDTDWKFLLTQNGAGEVRIADHMIEITSKAQGDVDYSVQLVHWDIPFYKGHTYRVSFDAKASEERKIITAVTAPYVDWIRYYPDTDLTVTTEWQTFTYEFEMKERDDVRGRLEFNLGNCGSTATVDITNVRVEEVTE